MNCTEIKTQLEDFLSGLLSGAQSLHIRSHLAGCRDCRSMLSELDLLEILPAVDETVEPSADIEARFHRKILAHRSAPSGGIHAAKDLFQKALSWTWPRQLAAMGSVAGLLAFGIYYSTFRGLDPGQAAMSADITIAENLPLLQDMGVIRNLDLLEDFDEIAGLHSAGTGTSSVQ